MSMEDGGRRRVVGKISPRPPIDERAHRTADVVITVTGWSILLFLLGLAGWASTQACR